MTASIDHPSPEITHERERPKEYSSIAIVYPDDPGWKDAEDLEAQTFIQRGYVDSVAGLQIEYAEYKSQTCMLVARSPETGEVCACARVTEYDPKVGFKTVDDALRPDSPLTITEEGWRRLEVIERSNIFEVGTMSAQRNAGAEVYGGVMGYGIDRQKPRRYVIANLDEAVLQKRILPLFEDSVIVLGPAVEYMGSPTVPMIIDLQRASEITHERRRLSPIYDRIMYGRESINHDN